MNFGGIFGCTYSYLFRSAPQRMGPVIALSPEPVRPPIRIGAARPAYLPAQAWKPP